jgi:hypothetical protein
MLITFLFIYNLFINQKLENMSNISTTKTWARNNCKYEMNSTLKKVLNDYNIKESDINISDLVLPCTYDNTEKEISELPVPNQNLNQKYFVFDGVDKFTAKDSLWENLLNYYSYDKTLKLVPVSYIINNKTDLQKLKNEHHSNKLYIMKKNIQRQEGLKITNDLSEIENSAKNDYVIVQELLQDPYLIDGRKINMRFYVLIICDTISTSVYVFNDGFMYYTKDKFVKNSLKEGPNITTGYIDRKVYEVNPLTHDDFKIYLDKNRILTPAEQLIKNNNKKLSEIFFNKIYKLLHDVFLPYMGKICNDKKIYNNIKFQLFGVDVAINDQIEPMVMEINKGPDMGSKDERDGKVKYKCIRDILDKVGIITVNDNGFIKILDSINT